jgi:hypothetical protein
LSGPESNGGSSVARVQGGESVLEVIGNGNRLFEDQAECASRVQAIHDRWESKTGYEVEIAEDIRRGHNAHQQIDAEDFKGYYTEGAAFLFSNIANHKSIWNTHFGPMMTFGDSASPDLRVFDEEVIHTLQERAMNSADLGLPCVLPGANGERHASPESYSFPDSAINFRYTSRAWS